jgi:hypothetical protein
MLADDEDVGDYPVLGQTNGRTYAALVCTGAMARPADGRRSTGSEPEPIRPIRLTQWTATWGRLSCSDCGHDEPVALSHTR